MNPLHGQLVISEVSSNSDSSFLDEDGEDSDWVELRNGGATPLSTAGYQLGDDRGELWSLPNVTIPAGEALIIFASGNNRTTGELHAPFSISSEGEELILLAPDLSEQILPVPALPYGQSYGPEGYFATSTPNAPNDPTVLSGITEDTRFSHDRGFYNTSFFLTISSDTPGAEIYFTTDGSLPSVENGSLFVNPIAISTTTTIRAIALKEGLIPTNVDTQTYLFPDDIIAQPDTLDSFPETWGRINPPSTTLRPADYEMDPEVIAQFGAEETKAALQNHPTISVVLPPEDLWNESTDPAIGGIYPNPLGGTGSQFIPNQGEPREWERACSVEFIGFPRESDKQINAGIRIGGNFARKPDRYKHHFRITSRREYGTSKIKGKFFSRTDVDTFDDVILRGGNSESWSFPGTTSSAIGTRRNVQYVRDQFYKDCQADMGNLTAHLEYFHLYLNGAYWGLYTLIERVDAHFLSQHLGGNEEDYDVVKQANEVSDGDDVSWNQMFDLSRGGLSTPEKYAEIQELLDLNNLIDYQILNNWMGNVDWAKNWRAGSRRGSGDGWQFYVWDGERGLGDNFGNMTATYTNIDRQWPYHATELHHDLRQNSEYRLRFADRVRKHLFNDGTFTAERSAELYNARIEEIKPDLIAESARWGDRNRAAAPYTITNEWAATLNWMNTQFFPSRTTTVLNQLRTANLYPSIDAPDFNTHGGHVSDGFPLLVTGYAGTTYFTTDGSDPRLEGGTVSPTASPTTGTKSQITLINRADTWDFNDEDIAAPADWKAAHFDSSTWRNGPAPIGYGGVTNTTIATTMNDWPVVTAYFRKQFEITDPSSFLSLKLSANLDGGAIFHLNGIEVLRDNMPEGEIFHDTLSLSDGNEGVYDEFFLPTDALIAGQNTLAIELHNVRTNSSDMGLDLDLTAEEIETPDLNITSPTLIKSRSLNGAIWSALTEATFIPAIPASHENLVIAEFMPDPPGSEEDDEFIELLNISDQTISLAGVRFDRGITYEFPIDRLLTPGERIVITRAEFEGGLQNEGETLRILANDDSTIQEFKWERDAPWSSLPDRKGFSFVLANPKANPDPSLPENWLISLNPGGTPGTTEQIEPEENSDLLRFALGDHEPIIVNSGSDRFFQVSRLRTASGVDVIIETSPDLKNWETNTTLHSSPTEAQSNALKQLWLLPETTQQQIYARVRVIKTP